MNDSQIFELGVMLEEKGLTDRNIDDFLSHYGVAGMKWGQRRAINKASRQKERKLHEKTVETARKNVQKGGKTHKQLERAKAQYKIDKKTKGAATARRIYNQKAEKHYAEIAKSQEAKNGKEVALIIGAAVGLTALSAILQSA